MPLRRRGKRHDDGGRADVESRRWNELVELLDRGGYARYDYRTATRLQKLATTLHGHRIDMLRKGCLDQTRAVLRRRTAR